MYCKSKIRCNILRNIFSFLFSCLIITVNAQVVSYDNKGSKIKSSGEEVTITIIKPPTSRGGEQTISLPGVIGSLVGIGTDIVKNMASNQEQKYIASYSASTSESGLIAVPKSGNLSAAYLNIESIDFTRKILDNNGREQVACSLSLSPKSEGNSGMFRFKLDSLDLEFPKAKVRKGGRSGCMIDVSIRIKLDVFWQDPINSNLTDSAGNHKGITITKYISDRPFQIKTATLGESTILVSSISPNKVPLQGRDLYSGWFQLIPKSALLFADAENNFKIGQYVLTIAVNEVNPYAIRAKNINSLLSGSNAEVNTLIKQIFPTPIK